MKPISTRTQWKLIGAGYACVMAFAAATYFERYLYEVNHRAEVRASSGMWAAGDMMLALFVTCLLMVPTAFLIRLVSNVESQATIYSRVLLSAAVTAPLCLGIVYLGERRFPSDLIAYCSLRLMWSPFMLAIIGFSRLKARYDQAKTLISFALLSEGATLIASISLIVYSIWSKQR